MNEKGNSGQTALHEAARSGKEDIVRLLLDRGGLNVNEKSNRGQHCMKPHAREKKVL